MKALWKRISLSVLFLCFSVLISNANAESDPYFIQFLSNIKINKLKELADKKGMRVIGVQYKDVFWAEMMDNNWIQTPSWGRPRSHAGMCKGNDDNLVVSLSAKIDESGPGTFLFCLTPAHLNDFDGFVKTYYIADPKKFSPTTIKRDKARYKQLFALYSEYFKSIGKKTFVDAYTQFRDRVLFAFPEKDYTEAEATVYKDRFEQYKNQCYNEAQSVYNESLQNKLIDRRVFGKATEACELTISYAFHSNMQLMSPHFYLGLLSDVLDDPNASNEDYWIACDRYKKNYIYNNDESIRETGFSSCLRLGFAYTKINKSSDAEEAYNDAFTIADKGNSVVNKILALYKLGQIKIAQKEFENGKAFLIKAKGLLPLCRECKTQYSYLQNDIDSAIESLNKK